MGQEEKKLLIALLEGGQSINMITQMPASAIHAEFEKPRPFDAQEGAPVFCVFQCLDENGDRVMVQIRQDVVASYLIQKPPTQKVNLAIPRATLVNQ